MDILVASGWAERRPDELKEAMEKLGQEAPSGRQLFALRVMGLLSPPPNASLAVRARSYALVVLLVLVLMAVGFGLAKLIALPFGGVGTIGGLLLGVVIIVAVLALLVPADLLLPRRAVAAEVVTRQRRVDQPHRSRGVQHAGRVDVIAVRDGRVRDPARL